MSEIADQITDLRSRRAGILDRLASMSAAERTGDEWKRLQHALAAFDAEIVALEDVLEADE